MDDGEETHVKDMTQYHDKELSDVMLVTLLLFQYLWCACQLGCGTSLSPSWPLTAGICVHNIHGTQEVHKILTSGGIDAYGTKSFFLSF